MASALCISFDSDFLRYAETLVASNTKHNPAINLNVIEVHVVDHPRLFVCLILIRKFATA